MKRALFILILCATPAATPWVWAGPNDVTPATKPAPAYPLWDGDETPVAYAHRVNLPQIEKFDLGDGVTLTATLIPAATYTMGTPEPKQPSETPLVGRAIMFSAGAIAALMLLAVLGRAVVRRQRPAFSLKFLLAFTIVLAISVHGGVRAWKIEQAWVAFAAASARFEAASGSEKPAHTVTLTKPYYMGVFEVTDQQFHVGVIRRFTFVTPAGGSTPINSLPDPGSPVVGVSWFQANAFCES
jgi:hypothetical protein